MIIVKTKEDLQKVLQHFRDQRNTIGFVPTMGNLHDGHLSLAEYAKQKADHVVVSIFVNPTQFAPDEDFESYPRTFERDCELLNSVNVDVVFAPSVEEVYPKWPNMTKVHVAQLGEHHCGASRPGHFDGVTTVVSKLFNLVRPDIAIFGEKDFQQLAILKRMTADLNFSIKIIGAPIIREDNGLAMSSRNGYLSEQEKEHARHIRKTLIWMKQQIENGEKDFRKLEQTAHKILSSLQFKPDYINIANQETLELAESADEKLVILLASYIGKVRLIDNVKFSH